MIFSKGCSFECVGACLRTVREFGVEPTWYHGVPPPVHPMTNSVVMEALSDVDAATFIVVVGTELPVTPPWLRAALVRSIERGARFVEYLMSLEQELEDASTRNAQRPPIASSVGDLQTLLRSAFGSTTRFH